MHATVIWSLEYTQVGNTSLRMMQKPCSIDLTTRQSASHHRCRLRLRQISDYASNPASPRVTKLSHPLSSRSHPVVAKSLLLNGIIRGMPGQNGKAPPRQPNHVCRAWRSQASLLKSNLNGSSPASSSQQKSKKAVVEIIGPEVVE